MDDGMKFADLSDEEKERVARETLGDDEYERRQANTSLGMRFDDTSLQERVRGRTTGLPPCISST